MRNCTIANVETTGSSIGVYGLTQPLSGPMSGLPAHGITLDNLTTNGGTIAIQDVAGLTAVALRAVDSPTTGVTLTRVRDSSFGTVTVVRPNRLNNTLSRGMLIIKGQNIAVGDLQVELDDHNQLTWRSLEIGGGDATDRCRDLRVWRARYSNSLARVAGDALVQGGTYAPVRWWYHLEYLNTGVLAPAWRVEERGDAPPTSTLAWYSPNARGRRLVPPLPRPVRRAKRRARRARRRAGRRPVTVRRQA
jgi:hypothetical protein